MRNQILTGGRSLLLAAALLVPVFAGCLGDEPAFPAGRDAADGAATAPWCEHPWPCGDGTEWPLGLSGPFDLLERRSIEITMRDGTVIRGWVHLPDVPAGVGVPVVMRALPYLGQTYPAPDVATDPFVRFGGAFPRDTLVAAGYAAVEVNVRGTGGSDGCFEHYGPNEQRDLAEVVTWLGERDWSNGRVAMTGLSYGGSTPWFAAIHAPEALKTIVPIGIVTDLYTFYHTPQGASFAAGGYHLAGWSAANSFAPPLLTDPATTATHAERAPERWCEDARRQLTGAVTEFHGDTRDAAFWDARRALDHLPNVTAAVWTVHGMQDNSGHAFQDDLVWNALSPTTPRSMLLGQWGHISPPQDDWERQLVAWFDYWLKGLGEPPEHLGRVDYDTFLGGARESTAWPPLEAHDEAVYVTTEGATPAPGRGAVTFRAAPHPGGPYRLLCDALATKTGTTHDASGLGVVAWTDSATEDVVIAGNPAAFLPVEADEAGGLVAVHVFEVAPTARCDPTDQSGPSFGVNLEDDVHLVSRGAADLRFLHGNYAAEAFAVDARTVVRIDMHSTAHRVPAGHLLAVVLSYGDSGQRAASMPYAPQVTLAGTGAADDAHVVLPVVAGTLGGGPVHGVTYPPRPFETRASAS